jgi:hypothetical protein
MDMMFLEIARIFFYQVLKLAHLEKLMQQSLFYCL